MKNDKLALVTGARKGLGLAWVKELAKNNYTVYLSARDFEKAESVVNSLSVGNILPLELDISSELSIKKQWSR